jgi:hypothetical protein
MVRRRRSLTGKLEGEEVLRSVSPDLPCGIALRDQRGEYLDMEVQGIPEGESW